MLAIWGISRVVGGEIWGDMELEYIKQKKRAPVNGRRKRKVEKPNSFYYVHECLSQIL